MSTYNAGRKNSVRFGTTKTMLATTALTAAGVLGLGISSAQADGSWANLTATNGGFTTDASNPNVTNIDVTTGRASAVGNADIYASDTVNVNASLFAVRDNKADPTMILGKLNSNGKIIVIDGDGVFFGKDSKVDVAGLIATTGDISDDQINNNNFGEYTISGATSGKVENNGTINIGQAGLAAFVAPNVVNNGVINAKMGTVALAAGEEVTLDMYGDGLFEVGVTGKLANALIENKGTIAAEGGNVAMTALAAKGVADKIVNNEGVITVASATQKGGKIVLSGGSEGKVDVSGTVDASGATGGGEVKVTGYNIHVKDGAVLSADATDNGNGGKVEVIADNVAIVSGRLSARGGANAGNGGFIDTSAFGYLGLDGIEVDTSAANGNYGTWLIDPVDFEIRLGTGDTIGDGDVTNLNTTWLATGTNGFADPISYIYESEIEGQDTSFVLRAQRNITVSGTSADGVVQLNNNRSLTLETENGAGNAGGINLTGSTHGNSLVFRTTGSGSITINAATNGATTGNVLLAGLDATGTGNITVTTNNGEINQRGAVSTNSGYVGYRASDRIFLDNDITTQGGSVTMQAKRFTIDDTDAVSNNLDQIKTNGGAGAFVRITADEITLGETGGDPAPGETLIEVSLNSTITIERLTAGSIGLGGATGDTMLSDAELASLKARELFIGGGATTGKETAIYVDSVDTTANIFGRVTLSNYLNQTEGVGSIANSLLFGAGAVDNNNVMFLGANKFNGLTVNANDHIGTYNGATITSSNSDVIFNADANAQGVGALVMGTASLIDTNGKDFTYSGHQVLLGGSVINAEGGHILLKNDDVFYSYTADSLRTTGSGTITLNQWDLNFTDPTGAWGNHDGSINNAGNAVFNDGSGQNTVNVGAGTYEETVDLTGQSNLHIKGAGQGLTIVKPTSMASAVTLQHGASGAPWGSQTYKGIFLVKDANNVDITGLTVDASGVTGGNGSTNPGYIGISYYNAGGDVGTGGVANTPGAVTILGGNQLTFGIQGTADDTKGHIARILNVTDVTSSGSWWAQLASIGNVQTTNVLRGNYDGTGSAAALDLSNGSRGSVKNAIIKTGNQYGENAGIVLHGGHDWLLEGNTITGHGTDSVGILDHGTAHGAGATYNVSVKGGTISNVGTGIEASAGGKNWDVDGTTITSAAAGVGKGIHYAGLIGATDENTIKNANITGFDIGVHNDGSNGTLIQGGTYTNNTIGTLVNPSSNVTIDNVTYTGGTNSVKFLGGDNNTVKNSRMNTTVGDAIVVDNSTNAKILKNEIGLTSVLNGIGSGAGGGDAIFVTEGDGAIIQGNKTANTHYNGPLRKGSGILVVKTDGALIGGIGDIAGMPGVSKSNTINLAGSDGIVVRADGGTADNNKIINNKIIGIAGSRTGIYTENATKTEIDRNEVSGTGRWAAIYGYGGGDFTITNNIVKNNEEQGIRLESATGTNKINTNLINQTGTNKKASDGSNSGDAIYVNSVAGLTIDGNTIGYKVLAHNTGAEVDNNIRGNGITVINSYNPTVKNNWITQATGNGIFIDPSNVAQLFSNNILNVDANGIWSLSNDDANIYSNTIEGAALDGILVQGGTNVNVGGNGANTVKKSGDDGIDVENTLGTVVIKNNIVQETGLDAAPNTDQNGIEVSGVTGVLIEANKISKAAWDGINVQQTTGATIKSNIIYDTLGASGIGVHNGTTGVIAIDDNVITKAKQFGIWVGGSTGTLNVTNNDISEITESDGIYVNTSSGTININGNDIYRVGRHGIWGTANIDQVNSNRILRTGGHGILITDSAGTDLATGVDIKSNIIGEAIGTNSATRIRTTSNGTSTTTTNTSSAAVANNIGNAIAGSDGIHVENSAYAEIIGNTVSNTADDGIYINPSHYSVIAGNTLTTLGNDGIESFGNDHITIGGPVSTDGNTISGAGAHGINVHEGVSALIQYNTVKGGNATLSGITLTTGVAGAKLDGIHVENNDGVEILNNTITAGQGLTYTIPAWIPIIGGTTIGASGGNGADNHGIYVYSSNDAVIDQNMIIPDLFGDGLGAKVDGIHVKDSNNLTVGGLIPLANGNKIFSTGADGIHIEGSEGVFVLNNIISGASFEITPGVTISGEIGDDGIDMYDTQGSIVAGNIITDTTGDGIEFTDGSLSLMLLNFITNAGDNGIYLDNTSLVFALVNFITDSTNNGILSTDSFLDLIALNEITGSGADGIHAERALLSGIMFNTIDDSGSDGIDLRDSALVTINDNTISNSDENGIFVDPSFFINVSGNTVTASGWDGIHVEDVLFLNVSDNTVDDSGYDGIDLDRVLFANVSGNTVTNSGDNGIEASNIAFARITDNSVLFSDNDGIHLNNAAFVSIDGNRVLFSGDDGIDTDNTLFVDVDGNLVLFSDDNGIEVTDDLFGDITGNLVMFSGDDGISLNRGLFTDIEDNTVLFAGDDGIDARNTLGVDIKRNNIFFTRGDGIQVRNSLFAQINDNTIRFAGDDGIDFENGLFAEIQGNDVRYVDENGIEINNSAFISVDNNEVADADEAGIFIDRSSVIFVTNNDVRNNDIGLHADGRNNGYINVTGNTFTNNRVGARFESGIIDLTGISSDPAFGGYGNKFIAGANGKVAIEFDAYRGDTERLSLVRAGGGYTYDGNDYDTLGETATPVTFGGTLGSQYFQDYNDPTKQQIVTLGDDTFVDPTGDAIWLDARDSTFAGTPFGTFTISGGIDQPKMDFLQSMFFHQPDANGRGIFFFGIVPVESQSLNDKDFFNRFSRFASSPSGLNLTITGLPSVGAPSGFGFNLNNITPFAGEEAPGADGNVANIEPAAGDEVITTAEVQNIEPAAGGGDAACWGQVLSAAVSGSVNYDFTSSPEETLSDSNACGGGAF
jgi:parallel beta-helix repeat protein